MEMTRENTQREFASFRASMKPEAVTTAEKSIYLEKRGRVGIIWFDQFGEKANKLSSANMVRFFELLTQVEDDKTLGSLVIMSKKPSIFIAGADINEIKLFSQGGASQDAIMKLQAVFSYLSELRVPSVAAIHGASMGGGTELILACDYRVATDAPETKIGLPEVLLGLIPGWGGTQRMPRLIGLEKSLDLILTGRTVDGKRAKKMGLVDKVVPYEFMEERVIKFAQTLAEKGEKRKVHGPEFKERILETVPGGKWIICDQAKRKVLEKSKGNYPAPLKAIEVIRKTYGGSVEEGLKVEAQAFMELMVTPESQNLIHVFFLNEKVKRDKGVDKPVPVKDIQKSAVIGAGVMGGGIAQLFAAKGLRVRLKDMNWEAMMKGYQAAHKLFKKLVEKRKMKPSDLTNAMERIEGGVTYAGFSQVDLVVEAAVEVMEIKKKIFQELESKVKDDAILATNTSSLSITELASATKNPKRVVGMHFFNPVDKMPLVEVIRGKDTSDEAVSTVFQLSKKLGKTPIVVKDGPGFVVNRILGPYLNEAAYLLLEGVKPTDMDRVIEKFGMPMGPCTLLDEVGLDVASKVSHVLYGAFGERMKAPTVINMVVEQGRLGKKVGKGIYLHEGKKRSEDPTLLSKIEVKSRPSDLTDDVIVKRLIYLMINEGARVIEEGLVREVADLDIGMIFGTGFAPFRGGLLKYADTVGNDVIVSELDVLAKKYGARFQPCALLQQMAVGNKKFYDIKKEV